MENPDFLKTKIENGPVILFEKRKLHLVSFVAAVPFGSAYEESKTRGIAHFIEHMAFKGTKTKSMYETKGIIEKVGGILNAFTAKEMTAYWCKLPSNHIDKGIDVISDIMMNPLFNAKELEKERNVILEEMKMYHDDPLRFTLEKAEEMLYEMPFSMPIIGTKETLNNVNRTNMVSTHEIYCPRNITVSVVGNFDFDNALKLIKEKFGQKKECKSLGKLDIKFRNSQFIEKRENIHQASVAISFHAPNSTEKMKYAADAFNTILGVGMSSRLFNEIREKRGLAYHAKSFYTAERSYGDIIAYIGTMKDKVKQVKELALKEIKKMQQLTSKELEEAKEQIIGSYKVHNEESDEVARAIIESEFSGNAEDFYKYPEFISEIKLEDVRKIAKIKNYSCVTLLPA